MTVILVFSTFSIPKETHAIGTNAVVGGILAVAQCSGLLESVGSFITSSLGRIFGFGIPKTEVPIDDKTSDTKEGCLDHLAWVAVNFAIEDATKQTVDWINGDSGSGEPLYVKNIGGFLGQIADDTIGEYILNESGFGFVCDPFKLQLRVSLAKSRIPNRRVQCTLSEVVGNVENFVSGDFNDGGWEAWGELVTRSNPYSQFLRADNELDARINARVDTELAKLNWGNGFLAWQVCSENYVCKINGGENFTYPRKEDEGRCKADGGIHQCPVPLQDATPGSVIENQLNNALDSGNSRLEVADEFNEIVSAILNRLIGDVLSPKGLSGLSQTQAERGRTGSTVNTTTSLCTSTGTCSPFLTCTADCQANSSDETIDACLIQCEIDYPPIITPPPPPPGPTNIPPPPPPGPPAGVSCIGTVDQIAHATTITNAKQTVFQNNPVLASNSNTSFNQTLYVDSMIAELINSGLNATAGVFDSNNSPSTFDVIGVWADGDSLIERYDILDNQSNGSKLMTQVATVQYLLHIPLACEIGSSTTPPPPGPNPPPPSGGLPASLESEIIAERAKYGAALHWTEAVNILLTVSWNNRAQGWGLSGKDFGTFCPSAAGPIACDILHHGPSNTIYDVLGSGPDPVDFPFSSGTAQWDALGVQTDSSRPFVAPVQP